MLVTYATLKITELELSLPF